MDHDTKIELHKDDMEVDFTTVTTEDGRKINTDNLTKKVVSDKALVKAKKHQKELKNTRNDKLAKSRIKHLKKILKDYKFNYSEELQKLIETDSKFIELQLTKKQIKKLLKKT